MNQPNDPAGNSLFRSGVFRTIMIVAILVAAARVIAPFEVGKDQATQLETAQRIVSGLGITTTSDVSPRSYDLSVEPNSKHLTWWPPGFSLMVAGLLSLGLSLNLALRLLFFVTTIGGWFGWATIVASVVRAPWIVRGRKTPLHLIACGLAPVFLTPGWAGTDIFLWALIPAFLFVITRSRTSSKPYRWIILAGLMVGLLYSIRYGSAFLGIAGVLLIIQTNWTRFRQSIPRVVVFCIASFLSIAPTVLWVRSHLRVFSLESTVVSGETRLMAFMELIKDAVISLPFAAHLILGIPFVGPFAVIYFPEWLSGLIGMVVAAIIFALPLVVIKTSGAEIETNRTLSLSLVSAALLAFLVFAVLASGVNVIGVNRYYETIAICPILLFYSLSREAGAKPWLRRLALWIVTLVFLYLAVYMPSRALIPTRRASSVVTVLGFMPARSARYASTSAELHYPSFDLFSRKQGTKNKIRELYRQDPNGVFLVEEYGCFVYDQMQGGPAPGQQMRMLPRREFWSHAFTSRPLNLYFVIEHDTDLSVLPGSMMREVYVDEFEKTRILSCSVPAGFRFGLQNETNRKNAD